MKKKLLCFIFAFCLIIPAIFCLSACGKEKKQETIYSIVYDYGEARDIFSDVVDSMSLKPNEYLTSMPTINEEYSSVFKGWFIQGTDKRVDLYDIIHGDITLEARFDTNSLLTPSGLYLNGKYVKTWETLKTEYSAAFSGDNTIRSDSRYISRSYFDNLSGELVIDGSITSIDDKAFYNCDGLKSVLIPKSVIDLGISAFENCSELESINIPNSIMAIPSGIFYGCTNLTNLSVEAKTGYKWQKMKYGKFEWEDVNLNTESLLDLSKDGMILKRVEI